VSSALRSRRAAVAGRSGWLYASAANSSHAQIDVEAMPKAEQQSVADDVGLVGARPVAPRSDHRGCGDYQSSIRESTSHARTPGTAAASLPTMSAVGCCSEAFGRRARPIIDLHRRPGSRPARCAALSQLTIFWRCLVVVAARKMATRPRLLAISSFLDLGRQGLERDRLSVSSDFRHRQRVVTVDRML